MDQTVTHPTQPVRRLHSPIWVRSLCIVLLLAVAYIHLGLFLRMISFRTTALGVLFGLNALAAVIAAVAIFMDRRWLGWILGGAVAGVAGVVRLAMSLSPSISASILGNGGFRAGGFAGYGGFGGKHVKGFKGFKGHFPNGFHPHFASGAGFQSGGLPTIPDVVTISIVIEFIVVALVIYALIRSRKLQAGST
ncbi:MAG: hypothetical protein OWU32_05570 [Firmicutes bacterium]|nr:hypothetical protein [Bacillota bacterium]